MPKGTIFSKYEPCIFNGLMIKDATIEFDYFYQDLIGNIDANSTGDFFDKCEAAKNKSVELDFNCTARDGLYEKNQLFAIYEKKDVENFIERLQETLKPI